LVSETETITCNPEPLEWASGSLEIKRDLDSGGIFSTYQSDSLTFIGNGAEMLRTLFEAYEVNAKCTLVVYWWKNSTRSYVEFPTRYDVNFNFYEKVKVGRFFFGVKIKAVNSSVQTKLDNRKDVDIDITKLVSVGDFQIMEYADLKKGLHYSATNNFYFAELKKDYGIHGVLLNTVDDKDTYTSLPLDKRKSDFTEVQSVSYLTGVSNIKNVPAFFAPALYDYAELDIYYHFIFNVTQRHIGSFPWKIQILECAPNGEIVTIYDIAGFGGTNQRYTISDTTTISITKGNTVKFVCLCAGIHNTTAFVELSYISITQKVSSSPETQTEGFPVYEATERLCQHILDTQYPIYSDFFGRTGVVYNKSLSTYASENQLRFAHIQGGMNIRGILLSNTDVPLAFNFKDLFQTLKTIWNVGYSFEMIDGEQRIRIEEYAHFFQDTLTLDLSSRITKYDIQSQVMPELIPIDIKSGFDNYEYLSLNGRSEPNTTNQRTSIMNTATKFENISAFRGDTKGIIDNLSNPVSTESGSTDTKGDNAIFIVKTQRPSPPVAGWDWVPEKATNIQIVDDTSLFKEDLLNRYFTPTRMLLRQGNRIASGMTKFLTSYLRFQKSDKSSSLITTGEGITELAENADILVSDLDAPIYKAIKHTTIIPAWTFTDLETLQSAPFGYIKFSDTISGYLLSFKKKNNEDKAEISIIEKYTS